MNYNQNKKIAQITPCTLIIGVDIAKFKHVARAQDFRGMEFGSPCYFENTKEGFEHFLYWISETKKTHSMEKV
ncbi:IS110 family transposase, partial [Escherichia coli]|nr:IS110 family transposase [Escherichia coli]